MSRQNGNDNITGGTGNDYLFGDSPDNASHSGNDTLVGGPGYDAANGGPGIGIGEPPHPLETVVQGPQGTSSGGVRHPRQ
ncbi:hypothetical protein ACWC5C_37505 [Streptomyces sp. NPDC001700]